MLALIKNSRKFPTINCKQVRLNLTKYCQKTEYKYNFQISCIVSVFLERFFSIVSIPDTFSDPDDARNPITKLSCENRNATCETFDVFVHNGMG